MRTPPALRLVHSRLSLRVDKTVEAGLTEAAVFQPTVPNLVRAASSERECK